MQESVIYQELREEARQEARQELRQELQAEVRQEERLKGEQAIILRLLARKLGEIPSETKAQIETLSIAQLEDLGEALLDFATLDDLNGWLA